jgi:hypothetical protein
VLNAAAILVLLLAQSARPLPSTMLMRIETVVEGEFRQVERGGAVRLRDVTVTPATGGASMRVLLTLQRGQTFEVNAERAYASVWQALSSQASAYKELGHILVSLKRSSREMTVECPARFVEHSGGSVRFEQLKKSCRVR